MFYNYNHILVYQILKLSFHFLVLKHVTFVFFLLLKRSFIYIRKLIITNYIYEVWSKIIWLFFCTTYQTPQFLSDSCDCHVLSMFINLVCLFEMANMLSTESDSNFMKNQCVQSGMLDLCNTCDIQSETIEINGLWQWRYRCYTY